MANNKDLIFDDEWNSVDEEICSKMSVFGSKVARVMMQSWKEFCSETSFHGFNHITAERRHWSERLLWVCFIVASVWLVLDISIGQWQRYDENPTIVTLEKDFRTWRIHMPAVTACLKNKVDVKKLPNAIKSRWNVEAGHPKYFYYSRFVTAVASSTLENLKVFEQFGDDPTLDVDLFRLAVDVMEDSNIKVSNGEKIKAIWTPVMTELGVCHTLNSVATADIAIFKSNLSNTKDNPMTCQADTNGCFLYLECASQIDYYLHSPYDVVDYTEAHTTTSPPLIAHVDVTTTEIGVGPGVRALLPRRRQCLFTDEPTTASRQVYSTHSCRQDCRRRLAMELCGCQPFYYFYAAGPTCTVRGMRCLSLHQHRLFTLEGQRCSCSQQCVDAVFKEALEKIENMTGGPFGLQGSVHYTLEQPRERYVRYIVFYFQDLVVSFGGAAGLFLGASFISFVEVGYFLIERLSRSSPTRTVTDVQRFNAPYETRIRELTNIIQGHFN
ncbi:pickpocket protein 11-like isoform X1 [Danaus plexippus]|uniref:pickpocket protein 11-like isoform X1 n=1 Tax=Danaus plexippus TaxID=13037 RepID=UPI002AB25EFB|nr:pickpocket protein 11-like isoform X1 [Danaus plexippus]